ncbi:energy coupling factor transporter S component ThiW [Fusibacter sp. 3D3]|uniref:energy coupling factor transporter S component ThiW n=1 Tax=Fusibacter sp. 3D3 TaxID=1048380 RepID=UPI00085328C4|nr:energy coupling factor transporter S component ThiW [Fusibacter sp. 3D3]GAU76205.1 substrate-specific component ThiW of predicted thiazole ECF transporter [Fusibacter sp. 3D3]
MKSTQKLTYSGVLIALGVVTGSLFYIPIGVAKAFPIQHLINVVSAVLLGPVWAIGNAFCISLLRNIMGTGSLLAFPGSMIGALLAGILFHKTHKMHFALLGEVFGTGVLGALLSYPIAKSLLGIDKGAFFFVAPFMLSTIAGSLIAYAMLKALSYTPLLKVPHEKA